MTNQLYLRFDMMFVKWSSFCNTKDRTPIINQTFVVYKFTCPGCSANYVGKTERTLYERCVEHA